MQQNPTNVYLKQRETLPIFHGKLFQVTPVSRVIIKKMKENKFWEECLGSEALFTSAKIGNWKNHCENQCEAFSEK